MHEKSLVSRLRIGAKTPTDRFRKAKTSRKVFAVRDIPHYQKTFRVGPSGAAWVVYGGNDYPFRIQSPTGCKCLYCTVRVIRQTVRHATEFVFFFPGFRYYTPTAPYWLHISLWEFGISILATLSAAGLVSQVSPQKAERGRDCN